MLKTLIPLLALALPVAASAAEPILIPDFTPGTPEEFALTVMLQTQVTERLLQEGHILLTNDVVTPVVGAEAVTNCDASPSCPQAVFPKLPARLAVVVRVTRIGGTLVGHFEMFESSNPNPVIVRDIPIAPGNEHLFAHEVAMATGALVAQLGPSPDALLMAAARVIAGQDPSGAPAPAPVPMPLPAPVAALGPVPAPVPLPGRPPGPVQDLDGAGPRGTGAVDPNASTRTLLEGTGVQYRHVIGSEQAFRNSGMDPRDWVYKRMPHAGRFTFEVRAGLGMGDVDRAGDIRVSLEGGDTAEQWYQEGPAPARRPMGGIYAGYAPATMIDIGVAAGFQWGQRVFSTGYARVNGENVTEEQSQEQSVDAVQFWIQPRVRGYLVPTGPAKPFLFTGAEVRVFDAYSFEQPENFQYPQPPGGTVPGWVGGGGMMIDPSPIVGFFFEASYTQHFGMRAETFTSGVWDYTTPEPPSASSFTVGLTGGVQFRI